MNWLKLNSEEQLNDMLDESGSKPLIIYKHSTRCATSAMTFNRLNRTIEAEDIKNKNTCFLDIIKYRDLSNRIADYFNVGHQSPQILLIKDKNCIYHDSHFGINGNELKEQINKVLGAN